jgi:hypothetical protein
MPALSSWHGRASERHRPAPCDCWGGEARRQPAGSAAWFSLERAPSTSAASNTAALVPAVPWKSEPVFPRLDVPFGLRSEPALSASGAAFSGTGRGTALGARRVLRRLEAAAREPTFVGASGARTHEPWATDHRLGLPARLLPDAQPVGLWPVAGGPFVAQVAGGNVLALDLTRRRWASAAVAVGSAGTKDAPRG